MMHILLSLAVLLTVQTAAPAPSQAAGPGQPTAAYVVGPSDVLGVKVFAEPDLSSNYNVDADGTITFPFLQRVPVSGKTVQEIEFLLTKLLADGYVNHPQVSVVITQFRSRSIYVLGEVRSPAKYNIDGPVTLLEVIAQAGSFTANAGPNIIVQRYKEGLQGVVAGTPVTPGDPRGAEILRVSQEDLREGKLQANIILQDGDTIFVPAADRFYVTGFVKTPGSFKLEPNMTVQQAIAVAGGISERGSTRGIKIIRKVKGKDVEIDVEMSDVVRPNDTIRVRQRLI